MTNTVKITKNILFFVLFFSTFAVFGQEYNLPLSSFYSNRAELCLNLADTMVFTAFKPLRKSYVENISGKDVFNFKPKHQLFKNKILNWTSNALFYDDLIKIKKNNLEINFNFLLNESSLHSKDFDTNYTQNTRGFEIYGTLGDKISFYSDFYENQALLLPYINERANQTLVVNGQGVWKPFGTDKTGKDYNYVSGYISYSPLKRLNLQAGQSKFFIGNGYRSLLLSDNSASYPFFKIDANFKKWQYVAMFTEFENFQTKFYFQHQKKNGSFVFVNYSPFKYLEIGLFEAIIWHTSDDSTYLKRFPFEYFLPIPWLRELTYGFNNQHNAMLGLNARLKPLDYTEIYGQFLLDNYTNQSFEQRYAFQFGIKFFDLFFGKLNNCGFYLQTEYNKAQPYTYTHEYIVSAYTHDNESLASPLGAGFKEFVILSNIDIYRFEISFKYNLAVTSSDTLNSNFGTNLLLSNQNADFKTFDNFVGQGNKTNISNLSINLALLINRKTNFRLFAQINKRIFTSEINSNKLSYFTFGIKSELKNFYTDF